MLLKQTVGRHGVHTCGVDSQLVHPEQMRIHVEKLEYAAVWSRIFILNMPFQLKKKNTGISNDWFRKIFSLFFYYSSLACELCIPCFWLKYNGAWVSVALCLCERKTERTNLSLLPNHFTLHWGPCSFVNGLLVETRQEETLETWPRPLKGTALPFSSAASAPWIPPKQLAHKHLNISFKRKLGQLAQEVIPQL